MIGVGGFGAVITGPVAGLDHIKGLEIIEPLDSLKTDCPAARYACRAFELLQPPCENLGIVSLSGATGATSRAFDKAWHLAQGNPLTGPGFGRHRSKRIHPFTLVRSLQNQVPSVLSMRFGLKGPCLNALDAPSALASLLPNLRGMLARGQDLLLVLTDAATRDEDRAKHLNLRPETTALEGAACFFLTRSASLGYLEPVDETVESSAPPRCSPILETAIELLRCMGTPIREHTIPLIDYHGPPRSIRWRSA